MNSPKAPGNKLPGKEVLEGVTVLSFGEVFPNIDELAMETLRQYLTLETNQIDPPRLVLDLTDVNFFGSSFIELLFVVSNRLSERKGKFAICGLSSHCAEVIQITHLDQLWKITKTRAEAIAAIQG